MQSTQSKQYAQTSPEYAAPQPIYITSGGTAIVVIAMLLLTVIIIFITSRNAGSAPYGIVGSVVFFLVGTPIGLLAVNGGIAAMFASYHEQRTLQRRDTLQYGLWQEQAARRVTVVDPLLLEDRPPAPPLLPEQPSFVPAVPLADEALKLACYQFVRALFEDGGRPSPKKVLPAHTKSPGLVQYEKPKPNVVEYLKALGMVWENDRRQLFFDVERYPYLSRCITAIKLDTPAGREGYLPSTAPLESGGA